MQEPELITPHDAALILGRGYRAVVGYIQRGLLPHTVHGARYRVRRDHVEALAAKLAQVKPGPHKAGDVSLEDCRIEGAAA